MSERISLKLLFIEKEKLILSLTYAAKCITGSVMVKLILCLGSWDKFVILVFSGIVIMMWI